MRKSGIMATLAGIMAVFGTDSLPTEISGVSRRYPNYSSRKDNQTREEKEMMLNKAEAKRLRKQQKKQQEMSK